MGRIARVVIADCAHHVTQRGVRAMPVFRHDAARQLYLGLMAEQGNAYRRPPTKTGFATHEGEKRIGIVSPDFHVESGRQDCWARTIVPRDWCCKLKDKLGLK
jgi:hypothetical protein